LREELKQQTTEKDGRSAQQKTDTGNAEKKGEKPASSGLETDISNASLPPGWEDDPNWNIDAFSQLPHREFGYNQHMKINEEFKEALRQILWQFKAPIRYAFAYGSGVFSQSSSSSATSLSPHPNPSKAVAEWQKGGGKMIDFIFGVSHTQHWHSLNLQQHRDHYSILGSLGSGFVSRVQDKIGAGVYFNPYITVNGTLIKYGVVNLDTLRNDLSTWDSLYLAGRLQKPVKILRDDPRVRLANQINLISAVRTALLMLPEKFTEKDLYSAITGISYQGDPRMRFGSENPRKIANIVENQMSNFRQLYSPLVEDLPNVTFTAPHPHPHTTEWLLDPTANSTLQQDMSPIKRGNMVRRLPQAFRSKLYFLYQKKFGIPGREYQAMLEASKDEDAQSFKRREGGEFDRRIAGESDLKDQVGKAIYNTVYWPSLSQTVKSGFTAGLTRSLRYYKEKRSKSKESKAEEKEEKGSSDEKAMDK
jgi:translocator assembly and maintenance protein 41